MVAAEETRINTRVHNLSDTAAVYINTRVHNLPDAAAVYIPWDCLPAAQTDFCFLF